MGLLAPRSNLERLKEDAEWEEDTQSWTLPELTRIKLPPASGKHHGTNITVGIYIQTLILMMVWVGASSARLSVNSLTAPARLENSLAIHTFHPLQVINNNRVFTASRVMLSIYLSIYLSFVYFLFLNVCFRLALEHALYT